MVVGHCPGSFDTTRVQIGHAGDSALVAVVVSHYLAAFAEDQFIVLVLELLPKLVERVTG